VNDERVVVVTGAAGAIGRAYVRGFAEAGYAVVAVDVRSPQAVVDDVVAEGGRAIAVDADVRSRAAIDTMVERALADFGRIDVLINNAAYFSSIVKKPFDEISDDEWDLAFTVNVRGAWLCARAVAPVMRRQGDGHIINTSSMTLHGGGITGFAHYASSKGAIVALTRVLARELGGDGIAVNTISPDYIAHEGDLFARQPEMTDLIASQRCFQRPQTPEDLVGVALFLAGPQSAFITGQDLWVNGGRIFH
jgi:3-oxoacyl-[acyl-carrier protein] reductase